MRTVTFSSADVRKSLAAKFVCTLLNTEGDPSASAGISVGHAPKDPPGPCSRGIGKQNVQCLFLTPQGQIFHAVTGFVGPNDLKDELAFVLETFAAIRKSPSKAKQTVIDAHAKRLKKLGFTDREIKSPMSDADALMGGLSGGVPPVGAGSVADFAKIDLSGDNFDARKTNGVFGIPSRGTVLHDYKFAMKYALLPMSEFKRQPQLLVGHGKSAFASTGLGVPSGGIIGK